MSCRRSFPILLAVLILGAQWHCRVVDVAQVQQRLEVRQSGQVPLQDEPACANESGCICKGAVLVAGQPLCDNAERLDFAVLPPDRCELGLAEAPTANLFLTHPPPRTAAAQKLRAQLQSFLL